MEQQRRLHKETLEDVALFGGPPLFSAPLHVGQLNLPDWPRFEAAFQGIFRRRHFTNHGPLVKTAEEKLAPYLGGKNAVCMANGTLAIMAAVQALGLTGKIIVPAFTFPATVQALTWAGLTPVFCDVDPDTHLITAALASRLIHDDVRAMLGVHLWGRSCDINGLESLAHATGIRLLFDAAHAAGCTYKGKPIGDFGDIAIFSFHATKVLNGVEGGCVTTNSDEIAAKLRTIRNFHSLETFAPVPLRMNAKMSEAQAAMTLLSLEDQPEIIKANKKRYETYRKKLSLPGIDMIIYDETERNNYQYVVVGVDSEKSELTRNDLVKLLGAESVLARRYFTPGAHRIQPYRDQFPQYIDSLPVTDMLGERLMQLPSGQAVSVLDINDICSLIAFYLKNASEIKKRIKKMGNGSSISNTL